MTLKGILSAMALLYLLGSADAKDRPAIHMMTALPLFWGDGDMASVLQGRRARALALVAIEQVAEVAPIDLLRAETLSTVSFLVLAQPPALRPEELVDLDQWVRMGGQLLIFADPDLRWSVSRAMNPAERPPVRSLLHPLFKHWQIELRTRDPSLGRIETATIGTHKVVLAGAGRWAPTSPDCKVDDDGLVANCTIDKGRVLMVADADLLDDQVWTAGQGDNRPAILALIKRLKDRN